jgi:hypothetical protein
LDLCRLAHSCIPDRGFLNLCPAMRPTGVGASESSLGSLLYASAVQVWQVEIGCPQ